MWNFRKVKRLSKRMAGFCLYVMCLKITTVLAQGELPPVTPEAQKTETPEPQAKIGEQNGEAFATPKMTADPYAGIVIDQTITVVGHDFFQYFIAAWRDKDLVDKYEIAINERPSARLGSQIWISYRQRRVFQTFLPASRAAVKLISFSAADSVYEAIVQTDMVQLMFKDPDLAPDEF